MRANQRDCSYDESATDSLGILKESLVNEIRLRASEATIDAFKQEGQGCRYTIHMLCRFRNPVHHYVVRRIVGRSIGTQKTFRFVSTNGSESTGKPRPKIGSKPIDAVRRSYISPPPVNGERWLHHSLLCSKAHDMPFTEFVQELGKTVKREESNLLGCCSWEQYRNQAWATQILLFSIHEVLLSKCHGSLSGGLPQLEGTQAGHDSGVGTANAAVAVDPSLPLNAESSTTRDTPIGAPNLNSTDTTDATAATILIEVTRRKLRFNDDAPAPVETPVETPVPPHRESPTEDFQALRLDAITEMGRHKGITATQFCHRYGDVTVSTAGTASDGGGAAESGGRVGGGRDGGGGPGPVSGVCTLPVSDGCREADLQHVLKQGQALRAKNAKRGGVENVIQDETTDFHNKLSRRLNRRLPARRAPRKRSSSAECVRPAPQPHWESNPWLTVKSTQNGREILHQPGSPL